MEDDNSKADKVPFLAPENSKPKLSPAEFREAGEDFLYFDPDLTLPGQQSIGPIPTKSLPSKSPEFPSYAFKTTFYAGEEVNLKERIEPEKRQEIAIYSAKFCPWSPSNTPLLAFVSHNVVFVYCINEDTGKIECVLKLVDPEESERYYVVDWSWRKNGPEAELLLATGGGTMRIQLINVSLGKHERTLTGHMDDVYDLKFHPFMKCLLLSASKDCSIRLWNIENGAQIAIYAGVDGHFGGVNCIDWHGAGELFASGGMDYCVKIWKITPEVNEHIKKSMGWTSETKKFPLHVCLATYSTNKVHNSYVDCIKFYGNMLMSKSVYEGIYFWVPNVKHSPTSVSVIRSFEYDIKDCDVWYVHFQLDPTGKFLLIGRDGLTPKSLSDIYVYPINVKREDAEQIKPIKKVSSHIRGVLRDIAFSPEGKYMVVSSDSGYLSIFCAEGHEPMEIKA